MNIEERLSAIAAIFSSHGLSRLEVSSGDFRAVLEKGSSRISDNPAAAHPEPEKQLNIEPNSHDFANLTEIKSPIVGVFYAAPAPDALPFVTIGKQIKKGDVLCIIEAMKQMNEIIADTDGEIIDICIKNGDIAEYGQTLFKIG